MIVGVPSEVKPHEYRVGMRPVGAAVLTRDGHTVAVQAGAGVGSGFTDEPCAAAGATMDRSAHEVRAKAQLLVKVKQPQQPEIAMIRDGQTLVTSSHFAADRGRLTNQPVAEAHGLACTGSAA